MRLLFLLVCCVPFLSAAGQTAPPPYKNPKLPIEQRVDDLLGRMTLEEKTAQLLSLWKGKAGITEGRGTFDPGRAGQSGLLRHGIGRIERASESALGGADPSVGLTAREQAAYANAIQRYLIEQTRLGIPAIFHEEALHGLKAKGATSFPQAIGLASTWEPDLVRRIYEVVARETRARGVQQVLSPVIDVAREPRWGRIEETFGEDPYLTGRLGVAAVKGFQGEPPVDRIDDRHVIATLKHMTGHGQPEAGMNVGPANYSERELREVFFPPFKAAVQEAGALALMPSYNEVNAVPSHANVWMLRDVLRGEWGFDGVIVSDWSAIDQLRTIHHIAADPAESARRALEATVDVELPDIETYHTLVEGVRNGRVSEAAVDAAVRRTLRAKFMAGLFENPYADPDEAEKVTRNPEHRRLALEAAHKAVVLLKNENQLLPLDRSVLKSLAVIGPHAAETLLGGYSGDPTNTVSVLEGIRAAVGPAVTVHYAEGVRLTEDSTFTDGPQPLVGGSRSSQRWQADRVALAASASNDARIAEAVEAAGRSDVVLLVLGGNEATSREGWDKAAHLGDRSSLNLLRDQERLVRAVQATGKRIVVLLLNGRPLATPYLEETIPAILEGWYLGQETGTAVADVLFGDYNPGGKLPVTIPRSVGQLPVFYNHKPSARRGYLFTSVEPLYPFGFGLSYTTFAIGKPKLSSDRVGAGETVEVEIEVKNTGNRPGDEVVQMYVRDDVSSVTRPVKELRGFERISLAPGESRTVRFRLTPDDLAFYNLDMKRVVEPGTFTVMAGPNSRDVLSTTLEVMAEPKR